MPHKETKTPTLFGVNPDREIFEKLKSEITKNGRSIDYLDIPYLCEAYRIERNKKEALSDEEIDQLYPERNDSGTRLDINMGRREVAKLMRDHFTNLNK